MTVYLLGSGAVCAVGIGSPQIAASVRAGLCGIVESAILDRNFEPIRMALMPEPALGELAPELDDQPLTARQQRLLRLAAPALQQAASLLPSLSRTPVLIGLPDAPPPGSRSALGAGFLSQLAVQSQLRLQSAQSELFPLGRASALVALMRGVELLSTGQAETVIVGGVDSHLDLRLLAQLEKEQRLLVAGAMDGFIPGEGAAFVVLSTAHGPGDVRMAPVVTAVAGASDPGHLYGSAPARGEGLARALDGLRAQLPAGTPAVACTWAGLNGENFGAKEWGVAQLRHRDLFCASMQIEHPADCYGDLGAATGAMLLALADRTMRSGTRPGPALVWAASDREPVGCAYLSPPLF